LARRVRFTFESAAQYAEYGHGFINGNTAVIQSDFENYYTGNVLCTISTRKRRLWEN